MMKPVQAGNLEGDRDDPNVVPPSALGDLLNITNRQME